MGLGIAAQQDAADIGRGKPPTARWVTGFSGETPLWDMRGCGAWEKQPQARALGAAHQQPASQVSPGPILCGLPWYMLVCGSLCRYRSSELGPFSTARPRELPAWALCERASQAPKCLEGGPPSPPAPSCLGRGVGLLRTKPGDLHRAGQVHHRAWDMFCLLLYVIIVLICFVFVAGPGRFRRLGLAPPAERPEDGS